MKKLHILGIAALLLIIGIVINFTIQPAFSAGDYAMNYFAAGDFALGVFAAGKFSMGIFSIGIFSVGIFSIGIFNLGIYAIGIFVYAYRKRLPKLFTENQKK